MLSDGFSAIKILLEQDQDAFKFLTEYNLRHEYKENGQPGHHLHSVGTVIGKLKTRQELGQSRPPFLFGFVSRVLPIYLGLNKINQNVRRLRFNNFDRAPIPPEDSELFYHCYSQLGKIINTEKMAAKRKLEKGLVIFVDNYRVMHGRTGFDGNRTVSGTAFS